jgi:hypothetical protein
LYINFYFQDPKGSHGDIVDICNFKLQSSAINKLYASRRSLVTVVVGPIGSFRNDDFRSKEDSDKNGKIYAKAM